MPEHGQPARYNVSMMGPVAARVLARGGRGDVRAVFQRSFYVEIAGEHLCIGVSDLVAGPLNVLAAVPTWGALIQDLRVGDKVDVSHGCFRAANSLILDFVDTAVWSPPTVPEWCLESVRSGLKGFLDAAADSLPDEGLGRFMEPDPGCRFPHSILYDHAIGPVSRLQAWLREAMLNPNLVPDPDVTDWRGLLGLGPGLTPSGDDLLGGVMIALHTLGQRRVLESLSGAVNPILSERTNAISGAHLRSAMEGMGCEPLHCAVSGIMTGNRESLPKVIKAIDAVGHTSGWDAMAGVVITMGSWVQSGKMSRSAA